MPIETTRNVRSISERGHFKANEWRNFAFYLIFPILMIYLNPIYLKNLVNLLSQIPLLDIKPQVLKIILSFTRKKNF